MEIPINSNQGKKIYLNKANSLIPNKNLGDYNQAIMDFGSTQCIKYNPTCSKCIFKNSCLAFKLGVVEKRPIKSKKDLNKKKNFKLFFS